ncbi:MAG: exopolyphosphatase [Sediminibacterium sp.]|nr:exopolyphosphatase [Sediminibacterium sp.]
MKLAALDIGSNAARLLIYEYMGLFKKKPLLIKSTYLRLPIRLGADAFTLGYISDDCFKRFVEAIHIFKQIMDFYEVKQYVACGTSALRSINNSKEIIEAVKIKTDINIDIISGIEEAELTYESHVAENLDKLYNYLYIDVGGGSTELGLYINHRLQYKESFELGTIRLLNNVVKPEYKEQILNKIKKETNFNKKTIAIGIGGNINKIYSLIKVAKNNFVSLNELKNLYQELSKLSIKERMTKYMLKEDRADVIVPALEIFIMVMKAANISKIYIPKISIAEGIIYKLAQKISVENKDEK